MYFNAIAKVLVNMRDARQSHGVDVVAVVIAIIIVIALFTRGRSDAASFVQSRQVIFIQAFVAFCPDTRTGNWHAAVFRNQFLP